MLRPHSASLPVVLSLLAVALCFAMPKPPDHAATVQKAGKTYYVGMVYVSSQDDTVRLRELGFLDLSFESHNFGSAKFHAKWPQTVVELPLPDYLNGMEYDVTEPAYDSTEPPQGMIIQSEINGHGQSFVRMDSELLKQMKVDSRNYPRPANGKPDTVILGEPYVGGLVYLRALKDSAELTPFGFAGFRSEPAGDEHFTALNGAAITYSGYHAFWPMDVEVRSLPECMLRLEADHMREGTGVVVVKRKWPEQ